MARKTRTKIIETMRTRQDEEKILQVQFYAENVKTLNGGPPTSTTLYFMELEPVKYSYKGKSKQTQKVYGIKGVRGWFRLAASKLSLKYYLEVCSTTDKLEDKHGNSLQSKEMHPSGACEQGERCIMNHLYGSRGTQGKIKFSISPIADIKHATAELPFDINRVKIRIEHRHSAAFNGKIAQDFSEQYFSGNFRVEIDISQFELHEIGFLLESLKYLGRLGRGKNTGYGKVHLEHYTILERSTEYTETWDDEQEVMRLEKVALDKNITMDIHDRAKQAWIEYVKRYQS